MSRTLAEIRAARLRAELQEAKAHKHDHKHNGACCEPCADGTGVCDSKKPKQESAERIQVFPF